jgi:hypothetical protein
MPAERNARQRSGFRGWLLGRNGYNIPYQFKHGQKMQMSLLLALSTQLENSQ